jgi:preprotein translocase subunit SecG
MWMIYFFMLLFVFVCLVMILLVLIQKGRGGGLSTAFGGGGGNTAFGAKTGDVLTWATSIIFGVFLLLAISLNLLMNFRQERLRAETETDVMLIDPTPAQPPQGE